jgi:hypothetical protein
MPLADVMGDLYAIQAEADHEEAPMLPCYCRELWQTADEWKRGPWLTHLDFGLRAHDRAWCGTADDAEGEWLASRSN